MAEVLAHIGHILLRALGITLTWHGTTLFAMVLKDIVSPFVVFVLIVGVEVSAWRLPSNREATRSAILTVGLGLFVIAATFIIAVPTAIYRDHIELVATAKTLSADRDKWKAIASTLTENKSSITSRPITVNPNVELKKRLVKLIDEIRAFQADRRTKQPIFDPKIDYIDRAKEKERWEQEYYRLMAPYDAKMKAHEAETQRQYESAIEPRLLTLLSEIKNSAGLDVAQALKAVRAPFTDSTRALIGNDYYIVYELKNVLDKL
jgi:hypothetical protein